MSGWDIAGGLIAAGLLVYLVAVLLRPEDFS
jgi:K+-transporting ATPase KdpF subunit